MREDKKILMAFRVTGVQREMLRRIAKKLDMTYTEVIGLALYKLAMHVFPKG